MDTENNFGEYKRVICLEEIDRIPESFKFPCNHKNFMHSKCIININNCPLCRINSDGLYEINSNNIDHNPSHSLTFKCFTSSLCLIFIFLMIYQTFCLYMFQFGGTYHNVTNISNITNISYSINFINSNNTLNFHYM